MILCQLQHIERGFRGGDVSGAFFFCRVAPWLATNSLLARGRLCRAASVLWRRLAGCHRRLRFAGVGLVKLRQRFREIGTEVANLRFGDAQRDTAGVLLEGRDCFAVGGLDRGRPRPCRWTRRICRREDESEASIGRLFGKAVKRGRGPRLIESAGRF